MSESEIDKMNHESQTATESKAAAQLVQMRITGKAVNSIETFNGVPTKSSLVRLDKAGLAMVMRTVAWALHNHADISIRNLPEFEVRAN